jgi:hypothetical protein
MLARSPLTEKNGFLAGAIGLFQIELGELFFS